MKTETKYPYERPNYGSVLSCDIYYGIGGQFEKSDCPQCNAGWFNGKKCLDCGYLTPAKDGMKEGG